MQTIAKTTAETSGRTYVPVYYKIETPPIDPMTNKMSPDFINEGAKEFAQFVKTTYDDTQNRFIYVDAAKFNGKSRATLNHYVMQIVRRTAKVIRAENIRSSWNLPAIVITIVASDKPYTKEEEEKAFAAVMTSKKLVSEMEDDLTRRICREGGARRVKEFYIHPDDTFTLELTSQTEDSNFNEFLRALDTAHMFRTTIFAKYFEVGGRYYGTKIRSAEFLIQLIKLLLAEYCHDQGEVEMYDANGNFVKRLAEAFETIGFDPAMEDEEKSLRLRICEALTKAAFEASEKSDQKLIKKLGGFALLPKAIIDKLKPTEPSDITHPELDFNLTECYKCISMCSSIVSSIMKVLGGVAGMGHMTYASLLYSRKTDEIVTIEATQPKPDFGDADWGNFASPEFFLGAAELKQANGKPTYNLSGKGIAATLQLMNNDKMETEDTLLSKLGLRQIYDAENQEIDEIQCVDAIHCFLNIALGIASSALGITKDVSEPELKRPRSDNATARTLS